MQIDKRIYKLPLHNIPFPEIRSLETFPHSFICCSSISIEQWMSTGMFLVDVYHVFDGDIENSKLQPNKVLFGSVVSFSLPLRGKLKCIKVKNCSIDLSAEDLPDLKYSANEVSSNDGKWFYMEKGRYEIFAGIRTSFENVCHLEGIEIYGENILRLRVVIELLKINVNRGLIKMEYEEFLAVAFTVFRSDPTMKRMDDEMIMDAAKNWTQTMLNIPLYSTIPVVIRGRRRNS